MNSATIIHGLSRYATAPRNPNASCPSSAGPFSIVPLHHTLSGFTPTCSPTAPDTSIVFARYITAAGGTTTGVNTPSPVVSAPNTTDVAPTNSAVCPALNGYLYHGSLSLSPQWPFSKL